MPVEWDEVKAQLMRLATDFGTPHLGADISRAGRMRPTGPSSVGRFIDTAADALERQW